MINKITEADLINKGVVGLPDVPGLTTIEMQNKFEEISRDVIIPRFNELIDNTVSASDEFSKLNTYNVGDYCIYQSVLYKCTTAITTAGEWDATKWKPTSIDKELVALNSNLTGLVPITETGSTTSRAYNFGEVIRYGNNLYVAAQNIAQGTNINDAITVGYFVATNVVSKINGLNNNKQNLLLGENEGFQDLKNWVIYHTGENFPVRVMPYGGLGWSDCPLGATYGTIIAFGVDIAYGHLVVCVPNSHNALYWNIINNSGNWINIDWNTIS